MPVRAVEWKKPYTWWKAIEIDENKVISLRLRDENNLIIWDEWDNEIYVDLQLDDEIRPTDAFPVWVTTGRVIVDNWWDATGTIICAKTTSWDNIKLFYADNGNLYIDNWTWTFKQIYFKWDVDAIAAALQNQIDTIMGLGKFLSIWNCATWLPTTFPLELPYEYTTWDWYLVGVVDNTTNYKPNWSQFTWIASTTVETDAPMINDVYIYDWTTWMRQVNSWVGGWVTFAQIIWQPTDNTNLATALWNKQDSLTLPITPTQWNLVTWWADNKTLVDWWAVPTWVPSGGTDGQVLSKVSWGVSWANAPVTSVNSQTWAVTVSEFSPWWTATTGYVVTKTANGYEWQAPSWWDVMVSSQSWNILTSWMKIWAWTEADYWNLGTYDNNTVYLTI